MLVNYTKKRRKVKIMLKLIIILFFSTQAFATPCNHTTTSFNCVLYKGAHDGDTFKVDIPNVHPLVGKDSSVRLARIDTPELNSSNPCERIVASIAKDRLDQILSSSKVINLLKIKRGSFFRIIAEVDTDKHGNISDLLLKEGLATPFKKTTDWCLNYNYLEKAKFKGGKL